jgi:hypothetical protein
MRTPMMAAVVSPRTANPPYALMNLPEAEKMDLALRG